MYVNSERFSTVLLSPSVSDIGHILGIILINCIFPCYNKTEMTFNKYMSLVSENLEVFQGIFSSGPFNK